MSPVAHAAFGRHGYTMGELLSDADEPSRPPTSVALVDESRARREVGVFMKSLHRETPLVIATTSGPEESVHTDGLSLSTSGTTNQLRRPVVRSWADVDRNCREFATAVGFGAQSVVGLAVPLNHSFGLLAGLTSALLSSGTAIPLSFGSSPALSTVASLELSHLLAIPSQLAHWLSHISSRPDLAARLSQVTLVTAGEVVSPALVNKWAAVVGGQVLPHYGSTEFGMIASCRYRQHDSGCGPVLPSRAVAAGSEENPSAIEAWLSYDTSSRRSTGDLGFFRSGSLHVLGRADRLLKRRGKFVDLAEIELWMLEQPEFEDVAVYSDPGASGSFSAAVLPTPECDLLEVRRRMASAFAADCVPDRFRIVPLIPRTSSGKADLSALSALQDEAEGSE